jgi:hypothetical protein
MAEDRAPVNQPRKPTKPFGFISFSKDGKVTPQISRLPEIKTGQEIQVAQIFSAQLQRDHGISITNLVPLQEKEHDIRCTIGERNIKIQITEISEKGFILPPGSQDPNNPKSIALFSAVDLVGVQIDSEKKSGSISRAIETKLDKYYASEKGFSIWLLIFTTSPFIDTLVWDGKNIIVCEPLIRARKLLEKRSSAPFDEIWFTDLKTRPVRIWPPEP